MVIEWHVVGMYGPGFFTGHLIKREFGPWVMQAFSLLARLRFMPPPVGQ